MQTIRDVKAQFDQFDPALPVILRDRCSQTNINPGRVKAQQVHVYCYRSTGQSLLWVTTEQMRTNEEFVLVNQYDGVLVEVV